MANGMIVAPQPEAVEAGARALIAGGNAVDAAIACALMQTVVDPCMAGIAGVGCIQLYLPAEGVHSFIDFYGRAPDAAHPNMWEDRIDFETEGGFGFIVRDSLNDLGYQAVTKPGSLMAFHDASQRYGRLAWSDLLEPAIARAEAGFTVRPHVYEWWSLASDHGRVVPTQRLGFSKTGRRLYLDNNGQPRRPGTLIRNPDMAHTLKRIAKNGIEIFYEGEIAQAIATEMEANGGLLSLRDLTTYRTETTEPLWGEYRGHRISTNGPPGGGVTVLEALHILEHFDLAALGHNTPGYIRVVSDAMKRASSDRLEHVADPAFVGVPTDRLLSKDYAQDHAEAIKRGERAEIARYTGGKESADTTHISAVDADGNAVSMTHTLGMPSGVIPEGLGILLNGSMNLFDPRPGHAASIAPGKARPSSIAPSIVFKGDDPFLIIGAPGGAYITMGILQVILNVIDFAMPISDAVAAARFSATGNAIEVSNRIPRLVTDELEADGYEIARQHFSYGFGGVHAILIKNGRWIGAADPGRDGMALEV